MGAKKTVCFLIVLVLSSGLICSGNAAPDTTISFRGGGVTIDLTYPQEAHPNEPLTHNITITSHEDLTLVSFALFIYAPVNATWQEVKNRTLSWDFLENETLTSRIELLTPENTNGILYCEMTVQTDQNADTLSFKFYTTHVSELTFSEMQSLYYEMLANYTALKNSYDSLLANYSSILANYTTLLNEYNQLTTAYDSEVAAYSSLLAQYNKLSSDYDTLNANYRSKISENNALQSDYSDLNSTRNSLQTSFNTLQTIYDGLNQTYVNLQTEFASLQQTFDDSVSELNINRIVMFIFTVAVAGLIVFIVYLKRKKEKPYVVIRKETVKMESEEES